MDPSKCASAPPAGWSGEKSSMGHAPPPPYQDQPYPGYPQPGPGYPPHPQGYSSPPQYGGAVGQQPYPMGQQATVTVQPTVYVAQGPLAHPVNDHLCYSLFTMLCCCLPLGIAALIFSISTRQANRVGNQMEAEHNSKWARILNHVGLGIGIGVTVLSIIFYVVVLNMHNN
ncbi:hypothetical protein JOQ06_024883 [Pogonophryne albipinna]|uniref:Proline-rich transmembrane protein 1 n=1 Tax=Pogonophryne albipinna TaxID=1090488 RepID=A0AAD6FDF8_9TELE|nr:hypothetical protein JOQ06_024883 [Pogonophryne albipinna]